MPNYTLTSGLPALPSSGLEHDKFVLVQPIYQSINTLAQKVAETTGQVTWMQDELSERNQLASLQAQNHRKIYPKAATSLGFGILVNLYVDAGKIVARKADASLALPAHGVVDEPDGIGSGLYGSVILLEGHTSGIAGSSFGAFYYLHENGLVATFAPPGAPIVQRVGFGLGSAGFYVHIESPA